MKNSMSSSGTLLGPALAVSHSAICWRVFAKAAIRYFRQGFFPASPSLSCIAQRHHIQLFRRAVRHRWEYLVRRTRVHVPSAVLGPLRLPPPIPMWTSLHYRNVLPGSELPRTDRERLQEGVSGQSRQLSAKVSVAVLSWVGRWRKRER